MNGNFRKLYSVSFVFLPLPNWCCNHLEAFTHLFIACYHWLWPATKRKSISTPILIFQISDSETGQLLLPLDFFFKDRSNSRNSIFEMLMDIYVLDLFVLLRLHGIIHSPVDSGAISRTATLHNENNSTLDCCEVWLFSNIKRCGL